MNQPTASLVWCPFPDRESARAAAEALLGDKLIACANILGAIESLFTWEGQQSSGEEVAVLFKTVPGASERMVSRLGELHPYDTPAIIGWDCGIVHPLTVNWLEQHVASQPV